MGTLVAPPILGSETLEALSKTTETGLVPPSVLSAWPPGPGEARTHWGYLCFHSLPGQS